MISGIAGIDYRPVVGRVGGPAASGVARGIEIGVTFDEEQYKEGGLYLMAAVLEHFFALYCNLNSFTQTVARTSKREGVFKRWPPRSGELATL
jgi:type VI secretion system protein ImpG